jgi:hypothetical protein
VLEAKSGDRFDVALLPTTAMIVRNKQTPSKGSELVLGTSSLCR